MAGIDRLILTGGPGERRIALCEGDAVIEFRIDRFEPKAGDVLQGRILQRSKGMGAAFVEIGAALPGFLPRPEGRNEGDKVNVLVLAAARRDKGAKLQLTDEAPQRRSALDRIEFEIAEVLVADPSLLPEARARYRQARLQADSWPADAFDAALARETPLPNGGRLIFDETAGAVVIDIDGGAMAPAEANKLALAEIARQVRLRSIAGHILIDAIPAKNKSALVKTAQAILSDDLTQIVGITKLGMLEVIRERRQPSLSEWFLRPAEPRRTVDSLALEALRAAVHHPSLAPLALLAAPDIIHYLQSRPDLLAETETRLGRKLALRARDGDGFEIGEI